MQHAWGPGPPEELVRSGRRGEEPERTRAGRPGRMSGAGLSPCVPWPSPSESLEDEAAGLGRCTVKAFYRQVRWVRASLAAQKGKNLPATRETQVWSLGQEEALEEGTPTPSTIIVWSVPWAEELGGLQSTGSQRVRHDWVANTTLSISLNGITLIISCIYQYWMWILSTRIYNKVKNIYSQ